MKYNKRKREKEEQIYNSKGTTERKLRTFEKQEMEQGREEAKIKEIYTREAKEGRGRGKQGGRGRDVIVSEITL